MTEKCLGIMGAGGLAREVLELASIINIRYNRWSRILFIDKEDTRKIVNGVITYDYDSAKKEFGNCLEIAMGIGEPKLRDRIFLEVAKDGYKTPTLIHPDVYIPETSTIGEGCIIQYGNFISCNVTIEDNVYIQPQCNIGHDDILRKGCIISGMTNLGGAVCIGRSTFVGLSSAVRELVKIGENSIVGMGSIVQKDVPDNVVVMGNPARVVSKNEDQTVFGRR